jgi:hypothetical protein
MIAILGGMLGLIALLALVSAIPISYRIEARSNPSRFGRRRFGYTNIWAVALNLGVARDAETQLMRRKILVRLALVALMLAGMIAIAWSAGQAQI